MMGRIWCVAAVLTAVLLSTGRGTARADDPRPVEGQPGGTVAARWAAIQAEFDGAEKAATVEAGKAKTEAESSKIYIKLMPDQAVFSHRLVDLAATDPADPAARDALLWVLDKPGMGPWGPYEDEFARAALLLLRHHGADPEVARVGLQLENAPSAARDFFLEGVYFRASGREAKGLARMALVEYLAAKADQSEALRKTKDPIPAKFKYQDHDDDGKPVEKEYEIGAEAQAYQWHLKLADPEAMRAEARRLGAEVIEDYGDVPYATRHLRKLEAVLRQPEPTWNGEPLKPDDRKQIERLLARKTTLADAARAKLDEMDRIVVGMPAPAIDASGMDGRPRKLADYRGKVVVLVFWGTWCGPCMQEVPHERELAERLKDKPFALLGVDCDADRDVALRVMRDQKITWPNWNDDAPGEGPIGKAFHVQRFPTTFVLDARGIIRHIGLRGPELDKVVDALLLEQGAEAGSSSP